MSKTKISKRTGKKKSQEVIETILASKKNESWMEVAKKASGPRKNYSSVNLGKIDAETKEGDTVIVVGKVLSSGEVGKKVRVCALDFSDAAEEKLKAVKGEIVSILEEIKKNPKAEGVKIIR